LESEGNGAQIARWARGFDWRAGAAWNWYGGAPILFTHPFPWPFSLGSISSDHFKKLTFIFLLFLQTINMAKYYHLFKGTKKRNRDAHFHIPPS
jgi:hypothetical protein